MSNCIGAKGAIALAQNSTIITLNLSSNNIGAEGAIALAKNSTIIGLNLQNNNIGDEGAIALAQNSTITNLDLHNNNIGDAGAIELAKNKTITSLDLEYNNIGAEGAIALAKNNTIIALSILNNKIGAEGAETIARNTIITSFSGIKLIFDKQRESVGLSPEDLIKIRDQMRANKDRMERITSYILAMDGTEGFDCVDGEKSELNSSDYLFLKEYTKAAVNYMIFKSSNNDEYRNKVYDRFRTIDRNEIFEQIGRDILHADGKFFKATGISRMGLPIETREKNTGSIPSKGVSESTTYLPGDVAGNIAAFLRNLDVERSHKPIIKDAPAATATPAK